jgi:hypothetical protein
MRVSVIEIAVRSVVTADELPRLSVTRAHLLSSDRRTWVRVRDENLGVAVFAGGIVTPCEDSGG